MIIITPPASEDSTAILIADGATTIRTTPTYTGTITAHPLGD